MAITVTLVPAGAAAPADRHLLARIRCRHQPPPWDHLTATSDADTFTLPLAVVDGPEFDELWLVDEVVASSQHGPIHCRRTSQFSFCWLWFQPTRRTQPGSDCSCATAHQAQADHHYSAASQQAYRQLLQSLDQSPTPHLLKIWHYLPAINQGQGDTEHYRQFCHGREQALREQRLREPGHNLAPLPAATAIGIPDTTAPALFYWLSASEAGANVENPRQTHAWRYPRQYGPASPNFSRGTISNASGQFLISGTASVVGHHTAHPHDTQAQTRETLTNLDSLLQTAHQQQPAIPASDALDGPLRVYLRHAQDWPSVKQSCIAHGLNPARLVPCQGDICRDDLMVEMDGTQALRGVG